MPSTPGAPRHWMMSSEGLVCHLELCILVLWMGFGAGSVWHSVAKRRLVQRESRVHHKCLGFTHFDMTTLRIMIWCSTQKNGLNTRTREKPWRHGSRYVDCKKFFAKTITTASRNHFWSPEHPGQARPQLVFTTDKDIVESNGNHGEEEVRADNSNGDSEEDGSVGVVLDSLRLCTPAQQAAVVADRRVVAARAKARALCFPVWEDWWQPARCWW